MPFFVSYFSERENENELCIFEFEIKTFGHWLMILKSKNAFYDWYCFTSILLTIYISKGDYRYLVNLRVNRNKEFYGVISCVGIKNEIRSFSSETSSGFQSGIL